MDIIGNISILVIRQYKLRFRRDRARSGWYGCRHKLQFSTIKYTLNPPSELIFHKYSNNNPFVLFYRTNLIEDIRKHYLLSTFLTEESNCTHEHGEMKVKTKLPSVSGSHCLDPQWENKLKLLKLFRKLALRPQMPAFS